jgi:hypothetical protein
MRLRTPLVLSSKTRLSAARSNPVLDVLLTPKA